MSTTIQTIQIPRIDQNQKPTVVIGHFDVHGVVTAALAAKKLGAVEAFAKYPETGPEQVIQLLQNRYAAAPARLHIVLVDIPVNLKDPIGFVNGLENLAAMGHDVTLYDHHETSVQFLSRFSRVKVIFVGPSAYDLTKLFVDPSNPLDELLARVAATGDRDPEVIRRGLWNREIQEIADGLDVMVRRDANAVLQQLLANPEAVISQARREAANIPTAELDRQVGPVVIARGLLPEQWGPKALEKLAFQTNAWYAIGVSYVQRQGIYAVRAIIRWDIQAKYPSLPLPGNIARQLFPTRTIIGHPAAPSIAASTEIEAREMALRLAEELARAAPSAFSKPGVSHLISLDSVGETLAEILLGIKQILENQQKMYQEYLELKRRQVELLERTQRHEYD